MKKTDAAVFILFGQSNAAGHWIPMEKCDVIDKPLKNVFGLSRELNQSFDNKKLFWSGYKSAGMNLAEPVDDTYSVANCLAARWQRETDLGEDLPDLYIVHIAKYMMFRKRTVLYITTPELPTATRSVTWLKEK